MFQPKKGKEGTKGQKQIYEDNKETLKFYLYMALGANVVFVGITLLLFEVFTTFNIVSGHDSPKQLLDFETNFERERERSNLLRPVYICSTSTYIQ